MHWIWRFFPVLFRILSLFFSLTHFSNLQLKSSIGIVQYIVYNLFDSRKKYCVCWYLVLIQNDYYWRFTVFTLCYVSVELCGCVCDSATLCWNIQLLVLWYCAQQILTQTAHTSFSHSLTLSLSFSIYIES